MLYPSDKTFVCCIPNESNICLFAYRAYSLFGFKQSEISRGGVGIYVIRGSVTFRLTRRLAE